MRSEKRIEKEEENVFDGETSVNEYLPETGYLSKLSSGTKIRGKHKTLKRWRYMQEIEDLLGIQKKVTKKKLKAHGSKGRGKKSTIVNDSITDGDFRRRMRLWGRLWKLDVS